MLLESTSYKRQDYIIPALCISCLLHLFLAQLLLVRSSQDISITAFEVELVPALIERTVAKSIPKPTIVSPPEKTDPEPDKRKEFFSDIDASTIKAQLKRGDGLDAGAVISKGKGTPAKQNDKPRKKVANSKTISSLKLDQNTLLKEFGKTKPTKLPKDQEQITDLNSYRAFSRPFGSGARFLGVTGSSDYLPHLPDGDITLLNTKASRFAVFVRRVATQVFGQLRSSGWANLSFQDIRSIRSFSTVRAVLSPKGKLLKIIVEGTSGNRSFDEVVAEAAQTGAQDPHPPEEAVASDGNIHFIFKARSWTQVLSNSRTGAPSERRWLLLATGLE